MVSTADAVAVLPDISTTQYFTEEAVSQKDMETVVQAGINAPSAMNGQPWHFSVITDTEVLQQISEGMGGGMGFGSRPEGASDEYYETAILLIGYEDTSVGENVDGFTGATTRFSEDDVVTFVK